MIRRAASLVAVGLWFLVTGLAFAGPGEDPRAWLERMSTTMSQMSYQGTFVFVQGDHVETMRVTHIAGEEGVKERLVALSGPPREVIRDASGVRWALGDDLSVLEDNSFNRSFFPQLPLDREGQAEQSYSFRFGKDARIAGQASRNVKVLPRDNYRYGYSMWLEKHSGMLLKWELTGSDRKPLARLMFTDVRIGSEVDPGELKPSAHLKKFKTVASDLPAGKSGSLHQPHWQPSRLPPGFQLTAHRYLGKEDSEKGLYEHLVYSDGLAAVSVYIESVSGENTAVETTGRHGTMHAYSRTENNVMVTVIGDVPAVTVQLIGKGISLSSR